MKIFHIFGRLNGFLLSPSLFPRRRCYPTARASILALVWVMTILMTNYGHSAALSVTFSPLSSGTMVDLSSEGSIDWAHWGLSSSTSFDHTDSMANLISNVSPVGGNLVEQTTSLTVGYNWTNGTPTLSAVNSQTGISIGGSNGGFQLPVAADTTLRRLKLFLGAYLSRGKLEAHLSDFSMPEVTNLAMDSPAGETNGYYIIDFAADSAGQTLLLQFTAATNYNASLGRVRLHSAALQPGPSNQAPSVTLTSPANESNFLLSSNIMLAASAFDIDGSIRKVEFFYDDLKLAEVTSGSYQFVWTNAPVGGYEITAVATDNYGETTTSAPIRIFIYSGQGLLASAVAAPPTSINLASEGTADWAHWGLFTGTSFDHKTGVPPQINTYSIIGNGQAFSYADNVEGYSWSGGTPSAIVNDTHTGIYVAGVDNGFEITAAADTTVKTLKLYVGAYAAQGRLEGFLSDFSAPVYFNGSVINGGNGPGGVYTINYRAASADQTLILRYKVAAISNSLGNVTLQAATLAGENIPPAASLTAPTNGTILSPPATIALTADASDSDGTIGKVEFYQGITKLGEATNMPYAFLWTNVPAGNYSLSVRAFDNQNATFTSSPINLYVVAPGGFLSGRIETSPAQVNLTAEGLLDWGHWGLSRFSSFEHKLGGTQITGANTLGGNPTRYVDNAVAFSWTNGSPVVATNDTTTGIYIKGVGNGFQLSVPADTKVKQLKLYLGLYAARGSIEAQLSDFSALPFADQSFTNVFGNSYAVYTFDFAAASPGKSLIVKYSAAELFDADFGNVTWQAATLHTPTIKLSNPQNASGQFSFFVTSEINATQAIEYCNLLPGPWLKLTNFTGNVVNLLAIDPAPTNSSRFYRVRTE